MQEFQYKKFSNIFANSPYIFILQHNNIKTEDWKKIKRTLGPVSFHKIPKKLQLFGKKQFSAPLCFLGCESPSQLKVLQKTLKDIKLPEHALLVLGLYLRNDNEFTFYNGLDIEKILETSGAKPQDQFIQLNQIFTSQLLKLLDLKRIQANFTQILQIPQQQTSILLEQSSKSQG